MSAGSIIRVAEKSTIICTQFHPVRKPRITSVSLPRSTQSYSSESNPSTRASAIRPPRRQGDYPNPRSSYITSPAPAPLPRKPRCSDSETAAFLHDLFQPHLSNSQPIPKDVAARMMSHASWNKGMEGHNGRLIFLGRRVLNAYMMMFLSTHPRNQTTPSHGSRKPPGKRTEIADVYPEPEFDLTAVSERLLDTYILGEYVGASWELQKVMRWTPALPLSAAPTLSSPTKKALRSSGLYKVRGACVEAAIGGIYHQYGGTIAHRIFHTHVLPYLAKDGLGLPRQLIEDVQRLQKMFSGDTSASTLSQPQDVTEQESMHEHSPHTVAFTVSRTSNRAPSTHSPSRSSTSNAEPISL